MQFVEAAATACLVYMSGLIDTTIGSFRTLQGAAYAGVTNIFLLTLFIVGYLGVSFPLLA